jgi:mono/diheme cytochrome c family protein
MSMTGGEHSSDRIRRMNVAKLLILSMWVSTLATNPEARAAVEATSGSSVPIATANLDKGKALFVETGCGDCHALQAARTHGQVGPSLDGEALTSTAVETILRFGADSMPSFSGQLGPQDMADLAAFVSISASQ